MHLHSLNSSDTLPYVTTDKRLCLQTTHNSPWRIFCVQWPEVGARTRYPHAHLTHTHTFTLTLTQYQLPLNKAPLTVYVKNTTLNKYKRRCFETILKFETQ